MLFHFTRKLTQFIHKRGRVIWYLTFLGLAGFWLVVHSKNVCCAEAACDPIPFNVKVYSGGFHVPFWDPNCNTLPVEVDVPGIKKKAIVGLTGFAVDVEGGDMNLDTLSVHILDEPGTHEQKLNNERLHFDTEICYDDASGTEHWYEYTIYYTIIGW